MGLSLSSCAEEPQNESTRYDSVEDLRDAVQAAGVDCSTSGNLEDGRPGERLTCGMFFSLAVFEDPDDAMADYEYYRSLELGSREFAVLVGENWTFWNPNHAFDDTTARELQQQLGGELFVIDGTS